MSKVVIKLGRTPLQPTHHNLLRQFIKDAVEQTRDELVDYVNDGIIYDIHDTRADFKVVCNKAHYITESYNIACSDIANPLLPRVIGYRVEETDPETQETFIKEVLIEDLTDEELELIDKSDPIYEKVLISSEVDENGEVQEVYDIQPVVPFVMNDSDFVILIGHISEFTQKENERSNVLVLTY